MSIILDDIVSSDAVEWDRFVGDVEGSSIYHLSAWRDIIRKVFGHGANYLCAKDSAGQIQAILPLIHLKSTIFGSFLVSMPYFNYGGCLAHSAEACHELHKRAIELAKQKSASHIEFRDQERFGSGEMPERTDKVSMRLELPVHTDELWSALGSKLRSQIKRPMREKPEVKTGGIELLDDFYQVFSRNMRDLGTPVYSRAFFKAIFESFEANCRLVIVCKEGRPVAVGFMIGYKDMMEIPWASSLREYNKYGFNMLMYWEALKLSIENSYKFFDFGRSSYESGTYRFKKQWGAKPVQMHWHYWLKEGGEVPMLNPANPKYRMAINAWKRLPLPVANFIGPMLVKNLP